MAKVGIAVAGAGLIGLRHVEEIRKSRSAELASVVDVSPKAAGIARDAGVPLYRSLDELFAKSRPAGVIVATPNQLHVEQALACVAANVPVLVEKPVADTVAAGVRLCEAAERAGAKVLVGHHRRHSPVLHKAVAIVQSGILGPLVGVIGSAVFYKPDVDGYYDGANAWRRQPGGGPILLNMIHEIGNLRAMVGEIVAVQAFASNAIRGFEVEDTVAINLRFANGALGAFLLSDCGASPKSWEQTSQENEAYPTYGDEDAYTLIGTRGSLGVPTMRLRYYESDAQRSWFKPFVTRIETVVREDPLANQIEHFAAVIRGEQQPLVTCRDGLANLRVTEAIAEAAKTGWLVATG
jgi:predicted dehydrogenase